MKTIYVKDFVSLPCEDAAEGIRKAIAAAKAQKADRIEFEKGVYPLRSWIPYPTDQTAHDAGAALLPAKDVILLFEGLEDMVISGKTDDDGNPATCFAGYNSLEEQALLPSIIWADNCRRIRFENLKLYRDPFYSSAGTVIETGEDFIRVEVFAGNPCYDGMATYCMNKFLPGSRTLDGESLSYGFGLGTQFQLEHDRILRLNHKETAQRVQKGDIITWHQGAKSDFQFFLGNSEDVELSNVLTTSANGFAMLAFHVHGLKTRRLAIRPEGNLYFAAPRDGFKLHKCSGNIEMEQMYIEGVRMDGQNMHSNYLFVKDILGPKEVRLITRYSYLPLEKGSEIEFYHGEKRKTRTIQSWEHEGLCKDTKEISRTFRVTFDKELPYHVKEGTHCLARCWEPTRYLCKDSVFTNIAGAGHLSRIDDMVILNCRYKNLMNPGILMGAEFPTHQEGGHCRNIVIKGCTFDNCGFFPRYGASGGIGIKSSGLPGKNNQNIHIIDCTFCRSQKGIDIHDASGVYITGCTFQDVEQPCCIDPDTTAKIYID